MKRKAEKSFGYIIIAIILVSIYFFWMKYIRGGDWSWTASQNAYWDAVVEMLIVFYIYLLILFNNTLKDYGKILCLLSIFLIEAYLHSFFVAIIVSCIYLMCILITGCFISLFFIKIVESDFYLKILYGLSGVIIFVAMASIFKVGTPKYLRIILGIIFFIETIIVLLKYKNVILKKVNKKVIFDNMSRWEKICFAIIIVMITFQVCRANLGLDYDSLWYGLRSQYVLAPKTGIFDKQILMGCVYTYSKGIETLTLPFAGLSTYGFILGINIGLMCLGLHAAYKIGEITAGRKQGIMLAMFMSVTPSIMNLMITAKSDTVTLYIQIIAVYFLIKAVQNDKNVYYIEFLAALILTIVFKPSSILFSTMLFVIAFIFAIKRKAKFSLKQFTILIPTCLSVFMLLARTVYITGYPMTMLITSVFKVMGIKLKYPYTLPSANTSSIGELFGSGLIWERIVRLIKLFFYPNTGDIVTLEITWWGCLLTCLWIISCVYIFFTAKNNMIKYKSDKICLLRHILFIVFSAASIGCMLLLSTPDGNYFMLLFFITYWFVVCEVIEWLKVISDNYMKILIPLLVCNFMLSICISNSWAVGVTPIDVKNHGYYNHVKNYIEPKIKSLGMEEIYNYLKNEETKKLITWSSDDTNMFILPAVTESINHQITWGPNTVESSKAFKKYMRYAHVDGLLIENAYLSSDGVMKNLLFELANDGVLEIELNTDNYCLLKFSKSVNDNQKTQVLNYLNQF